MNINKAQMKFHSCTVTQLVSDNVNCNYIIIIIMETYTNFKYMIFDECYDPNNLANAFQRTVESSLLIYSYKYPI